MGFLRKFYENGGCRDKPTLNLKIPLSYVLNPRLVRCIRHR